mmetsp:Transcript_10811/g.16085  ORF Transcript_10811/g.16085 Transcript_10811/m.16085 type:complete len:195 (-) Transcript_10811:217-801(-)|eukprot:CAMPEP_0196816232 /NCGR_PEP_ID=MMETSP1362-20130617/54247_1 /TAXON_ID=163516 /ORGANISM="Leptocylindrus danicus, Strain CCMP1856" /LENGTH=194 /DNA_ID=CAMNT_0042193481 /DNA_START=178 /DNA_END=762 /DNA_ORIENTATION=-
MVFSFLQSLLSSVFFCSGQKPDSSGDEAGDTVRQAREEAEMYANKWRDCAARSQIAWRSGEKARAKQLSNEGKRYAVLMEKANWRAVRALLKPQKSKQTGKLDLHGLYKNEAVAATLEFLDHWKALPRKDRPETVEIVTGAGNHSQIRGRPVIKPEVEKILRVRDLQYEPLRGDGAFLVYVNPPEDSSSACIIS